MFPRPDSRTLKFTRFFFFLKAAFFTSAVVLFVTWASLGTEIFHFGFDDGPYELEFEVLHEEAPRILYSKNFLSSEDCDRILKETVNRFQRSQVAATQKNGTSALKDDVRTSSGAWLQRSRREVAKFTSKISQWSQIPRTHGESVQILKYEIGQEYRPHYDYFDPAVYSRAYIENGGQRKASVLCFLSDVEEGGETIFPFPNIKVKPSKGAAVLWFNTYQNGTLDKKSAHGGAPVKKGIKYAAVQWMRTLPFN